MTQLLLLPLSAKLERPSRSPLREARGEGRSKFDARASPRIDGGRGGLEDKSGRAARAEAWPGESGPEAGAGAGEE
eukprot:scaffold31385_cov62-Phaeocystis_antarctica.AAC.10